MAKRGEEKVGYMAQALWKEMVGLCLISGFTWPTSTSITNKRCGMPLIVAKDISCCRLLLNSANQHEDIYLHTTNFLPTMLKENS